MTALLVLLAAAEVGETKNTLTLVELCGELLHIAALVVGAIGVLVILFGVARGAAQLVMTEVTGSRPHHRNTLRMDLGYCLLLGLEFLVAADIIETLLAHDLEHVLVLGAIVIIRTVISFSLNWELNQHAKHVEPTT